MFYIFLNSGFLLEKKKKKKKKKKKRSLVFGLVTGIPASSPPPALGCIQDYPGTLWLEYTTL
jgi:hypothetical protein